jgi:hypothetical protein
MCSPIAPRKYILPTIPVPSLINHIKVAANREEVLLPKSTLSSSDFVDKDLDKLLAYALKNINDIKP